MAADKSFPSRITQWVDFVDVHTEELTLAKQRSSKVRPADSQSWEVTCPPDARASDSMDTITMNGVSPNSSNGSA